MYKEWNSCFGVRCLVRFININSAVNVVICRKWRTCTRNKCGTFCTGLWVYWVNYGPDIQLKWSAGLTYLTNDRTGKNFIRIEIQIYLIQWFVNDRTVPLIVLICIDILIRIDPQINLFSRAVKSVATR